MPIGWCKETWIRKAICSFVMLCAASICMLRYCTDYSLLTTHYSTDY